MRKINPKGSLVQREVPRRGGGIAVPCAVYRYKLIKNESIPQGLRPTLRAPRRQSLLHALAKNVPLAHFLNASRPLHKGAFWLAVLHTICFIELVEAFT